MMAVSHTALGLRGLLRWSMLPPLLSLLLCGTQAFGQGPFTRSAIALANEGKLEEAEYKLAAAFASAESEDPMTWYVHAYVLKQRYAHEGRQPNSTLRAQSVESAMTCASKDPEGQLNNWLHPLLEFLGDSFLEDMRVAIADVAPDAPVEAEAQFKSYAEIQQKLDPDWDRAPEWVLLQQQLGETAMAEAVQQEKTAAGPWFALGVHHYALAANQDHDRFRSQYNLAVHTYNQGVREFKASEDDLDAIDQALNRAAVHWRAAADRLESAIALDQRKPEAYEALAIVSTALLNQDRIEWCKAHIQELEGR